MIAETELAKTGILSGMNSTDLTAFVPAMRLARIVGA
jgi:hypothetical protein